MDSSEREWLVTDSTGFFAMGTQDGIRRRKYHGFFQGIAGRQQGAFWTDLDLVLNGEPLWPHLYASHDQGALTFPTCEATEAQFSSYPWPSWTWVRPAGRLRFEIRPGEGEGLQMSWDWEPEKAQTGQSILQIRPLLAMRDLHGNGGKTWQIEGAPSQEPGAQGYFLHSEETDLSFFLQATQEMQWIPSEEWYYRFLYTEEEKRGYLATEDLYSAGLFQIGLSQKKQMLRIHVSGKHTDLNEPLRIKPEWSHKRRSRNPGEDAWKDYVLEQPAGICAGYPWFGEWGRDTFISIPGLVFSAVEEGIDPLRVRGWVEELLGRWDTWILDTGMIPNFIEKGGSHSWDSADGTLWWTHTLAALWQFSLSSKGKVFETLLNEKVVRLSDALRAIEEGRHLFLRKNEEGLLEVTEGHATWMDARLGGAAVTPRKGLLPEINALWFQGQALYSFLRRAIPSSGLYPQKSLSELEDLARKVLSADYPQSESSRPNWVFLHSIPIAPSFFLENTKMIQAHWSLLAEQDLFTPFGLRTLSPSHENYHPQCRGEQKARDEAYHQGTVWAWLAGHAQMMDRRRRKKSGSVEFLSQDQIRSFPIPGHIPEIFDADPPYSARGTPAQAWSVACWAEAELRRKWKLDSILQKKLDDSKTKMRTRIHEDRNSSHELA